MTLVDIYCFPLHEYPPTTSHQYMLLQTTFFNNDLDDEAKALIGDIRPKKIDDIEGDVPAANVIAGSSVWNTAGTWEERSMTAWGKDKLTELLVGVEVNRIFCFWKACVMLISCTLSVPPIPPPLLHRYHSSIFQTTWVC